MEKQVIEDILFSLRVFSYVMIGAFIGLIPNIFFNLDPITAYKILIGSAIIGGLIGIVHILKRMFWQ